MRLRIAYIISVFLLLFSCIGCSRQNIRYDFNEPVVFLNWGSIQGKLHGSETITDNTSTIGSPYELLLWFKPSSNQEGEVVINRISLFDKSGNVIYKNSEQKIKKFANDKSIQTAFFLIEHIDIDYSDYNLKINYSLSQNNEVVTLETILEFTTRLKKYRSIPFWDRLMSV